MLGNIKDLSKQLLHQGNCNINYILQKGSGREREKGEGERKQNGERERKKKKKRNPSGRQISRLIKDKRYLYSHLMHILV